MAAPPKALSLSDELTAIRRAVEGALTLAEDNAGQEGRVVGERQPIIAGILALVACRLRDLDRVVRKDMDAALLVAPHNDATGRSTDPGDILLRGR